MCLTHKNWESSITSSATPWHQDEIWGPISYCPCQFSQWASTFRGTLIFLGAFLPIFAIQSQFPWCRMPALWQTPCSTCLVPFTVFIRSSNVEVDVIWWRILEKCSGADVTFADNSCQSALSLSSAIHVQKLCNCTFELEVCSSGWKNPHICFLVTISPSPSPQSLPLVSIIPRQMLKSHPR